MIVDYLSKPTEKVYLDFHITLQADNSYVNPECIINYEGAAYSL